MTIACNNYDLLDKLENPGGSPSGSIPNCGENCRIFLTDVGYTGDLGGSQGADSICRNDSANPNGPGTGNWKAMLADENRRACLSAYCTSTAENFNWVMRPNTPYRRPTGELIGITNPGGIFVFNVASAISDMNVGAWTAIAVDWTNAPNNCQNWSSTANSGSYGFASATDSQMLQVDTDYCSYSRQLYCVEQ
jgi:hypothetical protein